MKIVKWGAVVLEALNILMALGSVPSSTEPAWLRAGAGVAAVLGVVVIAGLIKRTAWGAPAGVAAGLLSVAGGIAMIATNENGGEIGLVVGALIAILCGFSLQRAARLPRASSLARSPRL
jgi:hypothetical protein